MIRISFDAGALAQRLRQHAGQLAQDPAVLQAGHSSLGRAAWRSAKTLWPDFAKGRNDGK